MRGGRNQGAILPIVKDYFKTDMKNRHLGVSLLCSLMADCDLFGLQLWQTIPGFINAFSRN